MQGIALAPAAMRNTAPILGVLAHELRDRTSLLEIGSGSGQHAVAAAAAFPALSWQPTELADRIAGIGALIEASGVSNVLDPRVLDVLDVRDGQPAGRYDAVFTANTLHIVSETGVRNLLRVAGASLGAGGLLLCYGPFRRGGEFSTPSNAAFDASLRAGHDEGGIRDLEQVDDGARAVGLTRQRVYAMPANNLLVIWRKQAGARHSEDAGVSPISD